MRTINSVLILLFQTNENFRILSVRDYILCSFHFLSHTGVSSRDLNLIIIFFLANNTITHWPIQTFKRQIKIQATDVYLYRIYFDLICFKIQIDFDH